MGTIEKRIGNMVYIIKGPQFTHKRHLNQIRKRLSDDTDSSPPEGIDVIYNTFDIHTSSRPRAMLFKKEKDGLYCR